MKPILDPKRDLKGATPETLARALFRQLRPRAGTETVLSDEVPVEQIPTDKPRDGVPHLRKRA